MNTTDNATLVAKRGTFAAKNHADGPNWGQGGPFRITEQSFDGTGDGLLLFVNGTAAPLTYHPADGHLSPSFTGDISVNTVLNIGSRQGGIAGYKGDLAELLVYDHALSEADRNAVGSYLAAKYAVTTAYVPEPGSLLLLFLGGLGLLVVGSRCRRV